MLGLAVMAACAHAPAGAVLRIDGSTPEAFQKSWDRMHASLMPGQQAQLEMALLPIALGKYKRFTDVPASLLNGIGPETIRTDIDGLSYQEILDLAKRQPIKVSSPVHEGAS
jgi:hypothetical protein